MKNMDDKYVLFDFQNVVRMIQEKLKQKEDKGSCCELLESVNEKMTIEDMPFYKDYLSKFDTEHAFGDLILKKPDVPHSDADYSILQKLIYGSFSSDYKFNYDSDSHSYELLISVVSGNESITVKLHELFWFQIWNLFTIYLEEQFKLEELIIESEDMDNDIDETRNLRKVVFGKKIMQLKNQIENAEILSDMNDLLNS